MALAETDQIEAGDGPQTPNSPSHHSQATREGCVSESNSLKHNASDQSLTNSDANKETLTMPPHMPLLPSAQPLKLSPAAQLAPPTSPSCVIPLSPSSSRSHSSPSSPLLAAASARTPDPTALNQQGGVDSGSQKSPIKINTTPSPAYQDAPTVREDGTAATGDGGNVRDEGQRNCEIGARQREVEARDVRVNSCGENEHTGNWGDVAKGMTEQMRRPDEEAQMAEASEVYEPDDMKEVSERRQLEEMNEAQVAHLTELKQVVGEANEVKEERGVKEVGGERESKNDIDVNIWEDNLMKDIQPTNQQETDGMKQAQEVSEVKIYEAGGGNTVDMAGRVWKMDVNKIHEVSGVSQGGVVKEVCEADIAVEVRKVNEAKGADGVTAENEMNEVVDVNEPKEAGGGSMNRLSSLMEVKESNAWNRMIDAKVPSEEKDVNEKGEGYGVINVGHLNDVNESDEPGIAQQVREVNEKVSERNVGRGNDPQKNMNENKEVNEVSEVFEVSKRREGIKNGLNDVLDIIELKKGDETIEANEDIGEGKRKDAREDGYEIGEVSVKKAMDEEDELREVLEVSEAEGQCERGINEGTRVSELTEVSDVGKVNELTEVSEVPKVNELAEVSEVRKVNEVTEVSEVRNVDELKEASEVRKLDELNKDDEMNGGNDDHSFPYVGEVCETDAIEYKTEEKKEKRAIMELISETIKSHQVSEVQEVNGVNLERDHEVSELCEVSEVVDLSELAGRAQPVSEISRVGARDANRTEVAVGDEVSDLTGLNEKTHSTMTVLDELEKMRQVVEMCETQVLDETTQVNNVDHMNQKPEALDVVFYVSKSLSVAISFPSSPSPSLSELISALSLRLHLPSNFCACLLSPPNPHSNGAGSGRQALCSIGAIDSVARPPDHFVVDAYHNETVRHGNLLTSDMATNEYINTNRGGVLPLYVKVYLVTPILNDAHNGPPSLMIQSGDVGGVFCGPQRVWNETEWREMGFTILYPGGKEMSQTAANERKSEADERMVPSVLCWEVKSDAIENVACTEMWRSAGMKDTERTGGDHTTHSPLSPHSPISPRSPLYRQSPHLLVPPSLHWPEHLCSPDNNSPHSISLPVPIQSTHSPSARGPLHPPHSPVDRYAPNSPHPPSHSPQVLWSSAPITTPTKRKSTSLAKHNHSIHRRRSPSSSAHTVSSPPLNLFSPCCLTKSRGPESVEASPSPLLPNTARISSSVSGMTPISLTKLMRQASTSMQLHSSPPVSSSSLTSTPSSLTASRRPVHLLITTSTQTTSLNQLAKEWRGQQDEKGDVQVNGAISETSEGCMIGVADANERNLEVGRGVVDPGDLEDSIRSLGPLGDLVEVSSAAKSEEVTLYDERESGEGTLISTTTSISSTGSPPSTMSITSDNETQRQPDSTQEQQSLQDRRSNPQSKQDFDLLKRDLRQWYVSERERIVRANCSEETKRLLKVQLVEREADALRRIEAHQGWTSEVASRRVVEELVKQASIPRQISLPSGVSVKLDCLKTQRAAHLSLLYQKLVSAEVGLNQKGKGTGSAERHVARMRVLRSVLQVLQVSVATRTPSLP
eukprot:GHVN01020771.1.p1 GENE.GHVN01020771.1~~GHVN01020771.1.p1  ORF type:complete len:1566 (+),score=492.69 GHVN01020771.1:275-4972(+)